jgi:hypothetical protein
VIHRDLERSLLIFSKEISALIANKSIEYTLDLFGQLLALFRPYEFFEQRNLIKAFKLSVTQIDQDSNPEILARGDSMFNDCHPDNIEVYYECFLLNPTE